MDAGSWLTDNTRTLTTAGVPSARLDCLILLEDATGHDRAWLLAHPEFVINQKLVNKLARQLVRRADHIPLAYIRHKTEFYGRTFYIDEHVLEPRPESETIINLLKQLPLPAEPIIVDVGTGSGALAISAKLELPQAKVYAIDIDPECLKVARRNTEAHGAKLVISEGDLLTGLDENIDVVLANLPYVPDNFTINQAAMNEPRLAIFGGPDGLDLYRRMFEQMTTLPQAPRYVLAESLPPQHPGLAEIAAACGYSQLQEQDFIQVLSR